MTVAMGMANGNGNGHGQWQWQWSWPMAIAMVMANVNNQWLFPYPLNCLLHHSTGTAALKIALKLFPDDLQF